MEDNNTILVLQWGQENGSIQKYEINLSEYDWGIFIFLWSLLSEVKIAIRSIYLDLTFCQKIQE